MIVKNYKIFISATTILLLFGIILAFTFMVTNKHEDLSLVVLFKFTSVTILLGWLFGLILLACNSVLAYFSDSYLTYKFREAYIADEGPEWEMIRIRREMIAIRLKDFEY